MSLSQSISRKRSFRRFITYRWAGPLNWEGTSVLLLGRRAWGSQEGTAPEEAAEKLLEETRDGSLLLFLVGVCCSGIAVMRDSRIG